MIPILVKNGVKAISIGANDAMGNPEVPLQHSDDMASIFMWQDRNSKTEIVTLYHKYMYGGYKIEDCHMIKGFNETLCVDVTLDNSGPLNVKQVMERDAVLKTEFPNAKVIASTFDNFVNRLISSGAKLPVITSEMSDTVSVLTLHFIIVIVDVWSTFRSCQDGHLSHDGTSEDPMSFQKDM